MNEIEDQSLEISCDQCGSTFTELLSDAKLKGNVTCPGCGDQAEVDDVLVQADAIATDKLLDLKQSIETDFANLFKGSK